MKHVDQHQRVELVDIEHGLFQLGDVFRWGSVFFIEQLFNTDIEVLQHSKGKGRIEFVLVLKVEIKRARTQLRNPGNIFHRRATETLLHKHPLCSNHDLLPAPFPLSLLSFLYSHNL